MGVPLSLLFGCYHVQNQIEKSFDETTSTIGQIVDTLNPVEKIEELKRKYNKHQANKTLVNYRKTAGKIKDKYKKNE